jgi:membrane-associated HD superfamily phosphohydrolase
MLADSVEAAVRSIPSPSKSKIEEMVKKIVKEKLDDGQLDECGLTMKDLNTIISVFLSILNGIYHDRIEYPDMITGAKGGVDDVSNVR